ncbi:MAG TPA: threo-3-hydroxy-L-aspartate ammonia-lyase [Phototrophicaceae bacterium]|nr:threo-3-hydroxy-L-aspartate ammonia-lyase [Phototrophicaceae bacterium]
MFEQIQAAAERLRGQAHHTPVMTSRTLNTRAGAEVFLKCENLQRVGAFKFRGAYNAISQLSDAQKAAGVLAFSSGNHAQAVALVGQLLGIKTTIVMPNNAPSTKREATAGYGGNVILYDPQTEDRETVAHALVEQHHYTLIPPYNHEQVLAGQGTAALELHQDIPNLDMLFVPVGGGGLLSGCAIASKGINPTCRVIGVEPELANDAYLSFKTGTLHTVKNPPTIADGTRTPSLGSRTFPLIQQYADDFCLVSEHAIKAAVRFLFYHLKIVVEPSGALGVAALLSRAIPVSGRVGIILSGGNIDGPTMTTILTDND